jgi:hypothetical protein
MTTVPTVTRFDDFRIALWNLGTGTKTVLNPEALLDLQFETVPGVGGDRLKSATFQMPWYAEGRAAFDYDALQLVQIDRYSDAAWTLWGIVLKPKEGYSGRVARDAIQVQVVQIEELLKARKVHYSEEDGGGPITAVNAYPDDFAKLLVTKVFSGTDVDGNSRAWGWGTLAVAADASECAETASFALLSGDEEDDNLYKHVDGMARAYDFDYQLKVSVTGGAFTFTFETQAPYGGSDLTAGANRVMVKDLYNLVPSATRYRDAAMRATAMYVRGYSDILLDAAAITAWGRWEGVAAGTLLSDAEVALEKARVHEGAEYGFEATGANGMVRWLEHFKAGDKCLRINNRLGIAGDSEKIAAVIGRFQNKVLQLTIRWGDREPGLTDRQSGGGYAPGGGDGTVPIVASPVQTDGSTGVDPHAHVYGDHEHALRLTADDTNYAAIDANGVVNILGDGGIATSIVDGDLVIDGSGVMGTPGTLSVSTTNEGGDNHTHAITTSADPGATASILASDSNGYLELLRLYLGTTFKYIGASGSNLRAICVGGVIELGIGASIIATVAADSVYANASTTTLGSATAYWGPVYTTGPIYVADANNKISNDASNHLVLTGGAAVYVAVGGTNILAVGSTTVEPIANDAISLGATGKRFTTGYFSNVVRASKFTDITSDSFYVDPASTGSAAVLAGDIVMSTGKTVDGVDVSEHTHTYDKANTPTGAGSAHKHYVSWACANTLGMIDDGGGDHHHLYDAGVNWSGSGYYTSEENAHTHGLTYTSTASGAP